MRRALGCTAGAASDKQAKHPARLLQRPRPQPKESACQVQSYFLKHAESIPNSSADRHDCCSSNFLPDFDGVNDNAVPADGIGAAVIKSRVRHVPLAAPVKCYISFASGR